jgi:drug/metabolite transporter (DMT)-like permease
MAKWIFQISVALVLGVAGQLLFKEGASKLDIAFSGAGGVAGMAWRMFTNPYIFSGVILYAISTFFWILVLNQKELSLVYPLLASSYILVVFFSVLFRHEAVSPLRWLGVLVVATGVFLITRS